MDHYFHKHCLEQWREVKKEDFHCPKCVQPAANHEPLEEKPTLMQRLSQILGSPLLFFISKKSESCRPA